MDKPTYEGFYWATTICRNGRKTLAIMGRQADCGGSCACFDTQKKQKCEFSRLDQKCCAQCATTRTASGGENE